MKTVLMTLIWMALCFSLSQSFKVSYANASSPAPVAQTKLTIDERTFSITNPKQIKCRTEQIKQEISLAIGSLSNSILQTTVAAIDVIMNSLTFTVLTIAHIYSTIIFEK